MSAANGAGGQAPTSASQGQAPQANNGGSPSTAPQGQAPEGNSASSSASTSSGQQQLSPADYERMIADLRKEAAGHRTKASEYEKQLKQFQDSQLTAEQKRERDFAELQTKSLEYELKLQRLALENAGYRHSSSLGIGDVSAALALVQAEHSHEIKYGADGTPENIQELLKAVLKEHPVLAARPAAAPAASGGPTNPGRQAGNGGLTLDMIRAMSPREKIARFDEIKAWEKANANNR